MIGTQAKIIRTVAKTKSAEAKSLHQQNGVKLVQQ